MTVTQDDLDRLYAADFDRFTQERDALARRLRSDGDRDAADEVKQLRKPTLAAWALNRVRREHDDELDRLLSAGRKLREAQKNLLSGGDRTALRKASEVERRLVAEVEELAERALNSSGHSVSAAVRTRVRDTLHAAAGSQNVREMLAQGRLVSDHQASDLGLMDAEPAGRSPTKPESKDAARGRQAARARLAKAQARHRKRENEAVEAERGVGAAERELRAAERELSRAQSALERAQRTAAKARKQSDETAARVTELEGEVE